MIIPIHVSSYNNPWQVRNCLKSIRKYIPDACIRVHDDLSALVESQEIRKICDYYCAMFTTNSEKRGWTGKPASKLLVPQINAMITQSLSAKSTHIVKMDSDAMMVGHGFENVFADFKYDLGGTFERGKISSKMERHLWGLPPHPNFHVQGGFYVTSVNILEKIFDHHCKTDILSKLNAHEDVMYTAAVIGCDGSVVEIPCIQSQWKQSSWMDGGVKPVVLHPIKGDADLHYASMFLRRYE